MERVSEKYLPAEQSTLQNLRFRFLPYWPVFVALLVIGYIGLFFYLKTTNPVYETTASVLIKDEKKGQEESRMEEVMNAFGQKKIVENEQEILHSNAIIDEVVKKGGLYAPIYEAEGFNGMMVKSAYLSCPVSIVAEDPTSLTEAKKVALGFSGNLSTVNFNASDYPVDTWITTNWGKIKFIKNPNYRKDPKKDPMQQKFYFSLLPIEKATKIVLANLSVMPTNKQSSVIDLRLKDEVPKRAETTLSDLVDAYNTASVDRKNGVAQKTLQFIETRLKKVGQELDSMEAGIQRFRDRTGIVDITEQSRLYLQRVEDNDKQINNMDMQLAAMDEVEKYVTAKSGQGTIAPAGLAINDPSLNVLVQKLSQDESQLEKLKRTTAENNPILQGLQEDINKTKPAILDNIRNQRQSLLASRNSLSRTSSARSSALSSIPQRERELVEASRQRNIKSDIYSFLLQKREETAYSISSALPDAYLVSNPTTSNKPVSPVVPLLALLATLIPVALGVLYVSAKDMMNGRVLYRNDIQKLSAFPVIGELIQEKGVDPLVVARDGRTFIVEQFRLMRAALKHLGDSPGKYRRILVTSSVKGEGKSFVSTNLALSLARSGKSVALLEMDLHQPRITDMFGWEVKVGITDYLKGSADVEDIIYKSDVHANLHLVPAGHLDEDVSEMLTDKKLSDLVGLLEKKYDYVIIDTPPIRIITDAYVIAQHVDLVLFVVRHDVTNKGLLEMLDEDMQSHNIENVAFVFNGVKQRGYGKIKYGYGYGYGHASKTSYDTYGKNKKGKRA